jgi:hypothetical protein
VLPTFGWLLLITLPAGMIGGYDTHRRHSDFDRLWEAIQPLRTTHRHAAMVRRIWVGLGSWPTTCSGMTVVG